MKRGVKYEIGILDGNKINALQLVTDYTPINRVNFLRKIGADRRSYFSIATKKYIEIGRE